jgi:hypothetical protein
MQASQLARVLRLLRFDEAVARKATNGEAWPEVSAGYGPDARTATCLSAAVKPPEKGSGHERMATTCCVLEIAKPIA